MVNTLSDTFCQYHWLPQVMQPRFQSTKKMYLYLSNEYVGLCFITLERVSIGCMTMASSTDVRSGNGKGVLT